MSHDFTAAILDAGTAKAHGLVLEVLPASALLVRCHELAARICSSSRASVAEAKHILTASSGREPAMANAMEQAGFAALFGTADQRTRMDAFLAETIYGPMLTKGHERELLIEWAYRGSALRADAISDAAINEYLSHYGNSDGWRAALQYHVTLEQDAADNRALLADGGLLRMPTLGIDGEQDGRLSTATLAQIASNVQGVLIPDCKHWVAEEQPKRLADILLEFFARTK